jgi:uncharacterized phiE125 gp8 family phage protein
MMRVRELTAPPYEPVTLAQARDWARVDTAEGQDDVLRMLIKAMRRYAENKTGRVFIPRTFQAITPDICVVDGRNGFVLPYPPLISVESIYYYDTDGTDTLLAASQYDVHTWREPGIVVEEWDSTWPSYRREPDAWRISFTAGYSPGSPNDERGYQDSLPDDLKTWIHARIATLYENREQIITGTIVSDLPYHFADGLLDSLMVGDRMF